MSRRWSAAEREWLAANYGTTDVRDCTARLNEAFGNGRTEQAVYVKANQMGLHRPALSRGGVRQRRCERPIFWSREPEMSAFMERNDTGSIPAVQDRFEARFGFRPSCTQVSAWRARANTQRRRDNDAAHDHNRRPVGHERDTGKGYVLVKVAERPTVPGSKDNWRMKHVLAWERANGRPLPEGHEVVFADRDHSNFDPGNLVAVPMWLVGAMNLPGAPQWHDRESLEACIAVARLRCAVVDAGMAPRRCEVCGREFTPRNRYNPDAITCPDCVDAGHKAKGRRAYGKKVEGR